VSEVRVEMNVSSAVAKRKPLVQRAQFILDTQVIKDSNYYCPMAEGTLQSSALTASHIGQGLVMWATPYARAQYYGLPNKSHDKNINARMKWFEEAKIRNAGNWQHTAQEALNGRA